MSRRPRRPAAAFVAAVAAPLWVASLAAALEVPFLAGRVNDLAGLLSVEASSRIEQSLAQLERETGAQVAVLTIPSLESESLEEYSLEVAETWQLGRKGVDDGALLLVARDDRKMRLEVGYGLEGKIPDALAGRILDQVMRPRFREGRFDEGISEAVDAITGLVRGDAEALPVAPVAAAQPATKDKVGRIFFFGIFLLTIGQFSLRALVAKGAQGWFLYFFLIPFWAIFPLAFLGTKYGIASGVGWAVLAPPLRLFLRHTAFGRFLSESSWLGRRFSSSRGWSSSGGWSSGGGGFSGGGGSFGGGGSSSSW